MAPCNCQKGSAATRRTRPGISSEIPPTAGPPADQRSVVTQSSMPATGAPQPVTGTTQTFALVSPTGQRTVYRSRLEADAARVRGGYRGTVERA